MRVLFTIFMLTYVSLNCKCAHLLELGLSCARDVKVVLDASE